MVVDFKCPKCNKIMEVTFSIASGPPKEIHCPDCKDTLMNRIWQTNIQIPDWFSDDLTTSLSYKMKHAPRPSGKDKVLY